MRRRIRTVPGSRLQATLDWINERHYWLIAVQETSPNLFTIEYIEID